MDALRRLFGGGGTAGSADGAGKGDVETETTPPSAEETDAEERARELDLLRAEQARLGDLVLRQQRYADRKWVPPSQGGSRRSDDGEKDAREDR
jgi:hypothetical protein